MTAPATQQAPTSDTGLFPAPVPPGSDIFPVIAAVTGTEDSVGDILVPGAFQRTLTVRRPKFAFGHDWSKLTGKVLEIEELMPGDPRLPKNTPRGTPWPAQAGALVANVQMLTKTQAGREAAERIRAYGDDAEFSIGYQAKKARRRADGVRLLHDVDLHEISEVLAGAHPQTGLLPQLLAAKMAEQNEIPADAVIEVKAASSVFDWATKEAFAGDGELLSAPEVEELHQAVASDPNVWDTETTVPAAVNDTADGDQAPDPAADPTQPAEEGPAGDEDTPATSTPLEGEPAGDTVTPDPAGPPPPEGKAVEGEQFSTLPGVLSDALSFLPDDAEFKRKFTAAQRQQAADAGAAMPDGSFPIHNRGDLENAISAVGRAKDSDAARRHIVKRAKALGLTSVLPADWPGSTKGESKAAAPPKPGAGKKPGQPAAKQPANNNEDFNSKHPRGSGGKFAAKGSSSGSGGSTDALPSDWLARLAVGDPRLLKGKGGGGGGKGKKGGGKKKGAARAARAAAQKEASAAEMDRRNAFDDALGQQIEKERARRSAADVEINKVTDSKARTAARDAERARRNAADEDVRKKRLAERARRKAWESQQRHASAAAASAQTKSVATDEPPAEGLADPDQPHPYVVDEPDPDACEYCDRYADDAIHTDTDERRADLTLVEEAYDVGHDIEARGELAAAGDPDAEVAESEDAKPVAEPAEAVVTDTEPTTAVPAAEPAVDTDTAPAPAGAEPTGGEPPEAKAGGADQNRGNAERLRRWYLHEAGIPWGVPGDFDACVSIAAKHMSPSNAKGYCANRHKEATGEWPGPNAHGGGGKAAHTALLDTWTAGAEVGATAAHQLPAPALDLVIEAKEAVVPSPPGSLEYVLSAVRDACTVAFRGEKDERGNYQWDDVTTIATFPGQAYVTRRRYPFNSPGQGAFEAFAVDYDLTDAGDVVLGQPVPVTLSIAVSADAPDAGYVEPDVTDAVAGYVEDAAYAAKSIEAIAGIESKDGRVLSGVNSARLQQAVTHLLAVLAAAGVNVPNPSEQEVQDEAGQRGGDEYPAEPVVKPETTSVGAREGKVAVDLSLYRDALELVAFNNTLDPTAGR